MNVVTLTAVAGADGRLRFDLAAAAGTEYEVAVVVAAKTPANRKPTPDELGWPPGYFDNVIGSISDPAFTRQPQGEVEVRGPLE